MEKRKRAATRKRRSHPHRCGILVALNALSALGVYARKDMTKTERFTLSKGSANAAPLDEAAVKVEAYVTKGLPKLDAFVRDLRDFSRSTKTRAAASSTTRSSRPRRGQKKAAKDAGLVEQPFGEASETDEKGAVTQGFMGIVFKYGEQQGRHQVPPAGPHRRPRVLDHEQDPRDSRQGRRHQAQDRRPHRPRRDQAVRREPRARAAWASPSMQRIITQNFPFYSFQDVDLKRRRQRHLRRPRRPHHHCSPARTSPRRSCAASTSS